MDRNRPNYFSCVPKLLPPTAWHYTNDMNKATPLYTSSSSESHPFTSVESQKGAFNIQRCSVESQKGAIHYEPRSKKMSQFALNKCQKGLKLTPNWDILSETICLRQNWDLFKTIWDTVETFCPDVHSDRCITSMAIVPFWFSLEHLWIVIDWI